MEFVYDGPGLGKGGTATLYLDGRRSDEGKVAATAAMVFSADDTCDVGRGGRRLVADDYPVPNKFNGEVNWVEIDVGKAAEDADHQIDPDDRCESRWQGSRGPLRTHERAAASVVRPLGPPSPLRVEHQ